MQLKQKQARSNIVPDMIINPNTPLSVKLSYFFFVLHCFPECLYIFHHIAVEHFGSRYDHIGSGIHNFVNIIEIHATIYFDIHIQFIFINVGAETTDLIKG